MFYSMGKNAQIKWMTSSLKAYRETMFARASQILGVSSQFIAHLSMKKFA